MAVLDEPPAEHMVSCLFNINLGSKKDVRERENFLKINHQKFIGCHVLFALSKLNERSLKRGMLEARSKNRFKGLRTARH